MALTRTLTGSEQELFDAATRGDEVDLADRPDEARIIGPDALYELCVNRTDVHPKGVRLLGATITGKVDFEFATLRAPLFIESCTIDVPPDGDGGQSVAVDLSQATGSWITFNRCTIGGDVLAVQLHASRSFGISKGTVAGMINLDGAHIDGDLVLRDIDVVGGLRVEDATVGASITLSGAALNTGAVVGSSDGVAVQATRVKVGGAVSCRPSGDRRFTAKGALIFDGAQIDGWMSFREADLQRVPGTEGGPFGGQVISFTGTGLKVGEELSFAGVPEHPFRAAGHVKLDAATIGHDLVIDHAHLAGVLMLTDATIKKNLRVAGVFDGARGSALLGDRIEVAGHATFAGPGNSSFVSRGLVALNGARVAGDLSMPGAEIHAGGGTALSARRAKIGGGCLLNEFGEAGFAADGTLDLSDISVGGWFTLTDSEVTGAIALGDATIGSNLDLRGTQITGTDGAGQSLFVGRSTVRGAMTCGPSSGRAFTTAGSVELSGIHVGSDLVLYGAELAGPVLLRDAELGASLRADGAQIMGTDPGGRSLVGFGAKIGRDLMLDPSLDDEGPNRPFRAAGDVAFVGARTGAGLSVIDAELDGALILTDASIGASLILHGAQLRGTREHHRSAGEPDLRSLDAERLSVTGDIIFQGQDDDDQAFLAVGSIVLRGASVGGRLDLRDAVTQHELDLREGHCWRFSGSKQRATWPAEGKARLSGFKFQMLDDTISVDERIEWIQRQGHGEHWSPEPYEQLAEFYSRNGNEVAAQRVTVQKHKDELLHLRATRRHDTRSRRFWRGAFGRLLGFGYERWRAGWMLVFVMAFAMVSFWGFHSAGAMVSRESSNSQTPCGQQYPCFNPVVYGADIVLPIIDFGQDSAWRPNSKATWGGLAEITRWALIAIGWAVTSLFVAAFSGLVKKN